MKKNILLSFLLLYITISGFAQSDTWGVKFSNTILTRYTPTINSMTNKGWEYSNSIILHGMEKIYEYTRDTNYLNYIKTYIDSYINTSGTITPTALSATLDKIHPGLLCLFLYKETGLTKYKNAATNIRNYLLTGTTFNKTPDGGFWHKNDGNYNNVMMLDGIYMAQPFLAKYGAMFNDTACINTAVSQTLLLASHTYDSALHLSKHAWDYSKLKTWADPASGTSSEVWSRGLGWYIMAITDILYYLPKDHPGYQKLVTLLNNLCIGIRNNQDSVSGLWYQVVNKKDSLNNYTESSGSGMFIYTLKKAVNNEWIDSSYLAICRKGWEGLKTQIGTYTDGLPKINSFAPAMSVQNSYKDYVNSPYTAVNCPAAIGTQHPHGYAGLLMASSVMEFPVTTYTFTGNGDWYLASNWLNNSIPPNTLPKCSAIIIDPIPDGSCTLTGTQHISAGAKLTVMKGKKFFITGKLVID